MAHIRVFDLALILGLGIAFPLVHQMNSWMFSFAEITPSVGLVYLPAFLRLLNVLVLGKFKGTVAGLLGGALLLLLHPSEETLSIQLVNMLCSSAGPLLAVLTFERWRQHPVDLVSLKDLGIVTLIYCVANSLLHHFAWSMVAPHLLGTPQQMIWMFFGDLIGALIGAYLLKCGASRLKITQG